MESFKYYAPTEVIFGKNAVDSLKDEISKRNKKHVLVVYGSDRIKKNGLLDRIKNQIEQAGAKYSAMGGVQANPTVEHVNEILEAYMDDQPDLILAVGGGSAIDTAKAAAVGFAHHEKDIWPFWTKEKEAKAALDVASVLTIPAAGSEMSDSAVLTNEATHQKKGLNTDLNRPVFALMDPTLCSTLPQYQVACGVTDILMHTLERYFSSETGSNELTDAIAEALMRTVIANGPDVYMDPSNTHAMSEIMWAGSLSHNNLTGLGREKDFSVHQFGHELSAKYHIAHGASLASVWDSFARYTMKANPSRYARYARNVWGIEEADDEKAALKGIGATEALFKSLRMPTSLKDAKEIGKLDDETLKELALGITWNDQRKIGKFMPLNTEQVYEVLKAANEK